MNAAKRGPGRPKKIVTQSLGETKKKVKLEKDEDLYHPQFVGTEGRSRPYKDNLSYSEASDSHGDDEEDTYDGKVSSSATKRKVKGRLDNSLGVLTKKFIEMIRRAPNHTIDLNDAVKLLNVQKRRIYDITNVLEGIGYIQKILKNKITWIGGDGSNIESMDNGDLEDLMDELSTLHKEDEDMDYWIDKLQSVLNAVSDDEANNMHSYVTFDEIKAVNTVEDNDQPFLVIRAPKGTLLEVPAPDQEGLEEHPHKMTLTSQSEEIYIYVVSNDNPDGGSQSAPTNIY